MIVDRRVRSAASSARLAVAAVLLTSCSHSDAFTPHDNGSNEPFSAGTPLRLTYNPQPDLAPAWLPDGASFIYAFVRTDPQHDQCLGIMGAGGGSLSREICSRSAFASDSIDTYSWPAVSTDSTLAYARASRFRTALVDATDAVVAAPLASPDALTVLQRFPIQLGSTFYVAPGSPAWVSDSSLAYLGLIDTSIMLAASSISVRNGANVLLSHRGGAATTVVPGTRWATSVAPADPGNAFVTFANSGAVMRLPLAGGTGSLVYDFGPAGIARDVSGGPARLAVVVGGVVHVYVADGNPIQQDIAGRLFVLEPATGSAHEIAVPRMLFRHPALSPDGMSIVVEAFAMRVDTIGGPVVRIDTTVTGTGDLVKLPAQ